MNILGINGVAGAGKDSAADRLVSHHGYIKVSLADPLKRICQSVYGFTDDQLWGPSSSRNAPDKRYIRERHARHEWQEATTKPREMRTARGVKVASPKDHGHHFQCSRCGALGDENPAECIVYLTPRFALQILGTEFGRTCYPNTWIDLNIRTAKSILLEGKGYTPQRGLFERTDKKPSPRGVVVPDVRFKNEMDAIAAEGGYLWRVKGPNEPRPIKTEGWRQHKSETEQAEVSDDPSTSSS
jgi:hypothetical protein